jgi:PIN domain nuclease of toxin-antitoxin system
MLNLDTHILVDIMVGHLNNKEEKLLKSQTWAISDIVLWELHKLNQLGRIEFDFNNLEIRNFLKTLHVIPISLEILSAIDELDFKFDPADEIIAATSIKNKIPLVTRDSKLLKSKKVPLLKGF